MVNPPELHMQSGTCVKVATYIEHEVDKVLIDQEGKERGKQYNKDIYILLLINCISKSLSISTIRMSAILGLHIP